MSMLESAYEVTGESPFQEWEAAGGNAEAEYGQGEFETGYGPGEFESGYGAGEFETGYGPGEFETGYGAGEFETGYGPGELETGYPTGELETGYEAELVQELLGTSSEAELEQFLGGLVRSTFGNVGKLLRSDVGRALTGVLKGVAKRALPLAGSALGTFVAPGVGTALGGQLGTFASSMFETGEAETLGEDELELEAARRYIRFARATVGQASRAPSHLPGPVVARAAAIAAARRYAPTLLRSAWQPPRWRDRRSTRYRGYWHPRPYFPPPSYDAWSPPPGAGAWPPAQPAPPAAAMPPGQPYSWQPPQPLSGSMGAGTQDDAAGAPGDGFGAFDSPQPGDDGDPLATASHDDASEFGMF
jgi:hypothetical protein